MGLSAGLLDGIALSVVSVHKVGRAAGILNTFRLGSEAIAVAIYGSLMSTGIFHLLFSRPVPEGITSKQYLADVVSGNVFSSANADQTDWLESVYTHAFSNTLLLLIVPICFFLKSLSALHSNTYQTLTWEISVTLVNLIYRQVDILKQG